MHIAELWRYPVKSLAGERLEWAAIRTDGIEGDRIVHVRAPSGRVVTSRTHPGLLSLHGTLADQGRPAVNGSPWDDPRSLEAVRHAAGDTTFELVHSAGAERFDVLPLSVATDGAIVAMGVDGRRFRPNLVIGGVEGLEERAWPGRHLRLGEVVISIARLRPRCVMTTYDPDTQEQSLDVLRRIVTEYAGSFALDCAVVEPGRVAVGDPVALLPR